MQEKKVTAKYANRPARPSAATKPDRSRKKRKKAKKSIANRRAEGVSPLRREAILALLCEERKLLSRQMLHLAARRICARKQDLNK
jgi:hypothetical protein